MIPRRRPLALAPLSLAMCLVGCQTLPPAGAPADSAATGPQAVAASATVPASAPEPSPAPVASPTAVPSPAAAPPVMAAALPRGVSPGDWAADDTWGRLRRGFALEPLPHPLAAQHARRLAEADFFQRRAERLRLYLPLIVEEVQSRGLPLELALIPLVESELNPHARSPVGALGTWQFMRPTAQRFELRSSRLVDDRKNLVAATRAALDYLQTLHGLFGDWHLAMAAYNWGEGRVQRAVARQRAAGGRVDFTSLAEGMPAETRHYVPQIDALRRLIDDPSAWAVQLPALPDGHALRSVPLTADVDLALALRWSGLPEREFLALNPAVRPPLLMARATPELLLPAEAALRWQAGLAAHTGALASWRAIRLDKATPLPVLASRHGTTVEALRTDNAIAAGHKPLAGSVLLVRSPQAPGMQTSESLVATASMATAPDLVRSSTRVRRGETLAAVARRTGVSAEALARWNALRGRPATLRLAPGRQLELWVPRPARGTVRS